MISWLVLAIPYFSLPFVVEYDSSGEGIGAILIQNGHTLTYKSRKVCNLEKGCLVYENKVLDIIHALEEFRQYIVCGKFMVKKDHNSLILFMHQKNLNKLQKIWVRKMQSYDFEIEYIKYKANVIVNKLSRKPFLCSLSTILYDCKDNIIF